MFNFYKFIYLSCLFSLGQSSRIVMYRTNKSDHLSAIPNLEKGFQYIILKNAIGWRFYIGILYQSLYTSGWQKMDLEF